MDRFSDFPDPVRDAISFAEGLPAEFGSWTAAHALKRLRVRFGLTRKALAAKAAVSASLVGRAEKGADVRLSTLSRLYAAVGCRLVTLPAGGLFDLDWNDAHVDDEWITWKRENARYLGDGVSGDFTDAGASGMKRNANVSDAV